MAAATVTEKLDALLSDPNAEIAAVCSLLVEAISAADEQALRLAMKKLPAREGGELLVELCGQALRQLRDLAPAQQVEPGSHAHRFLSLIAASSGLSNGELVDGLGTDETEVSRVGRKLLEGGYAFRQKVGRRNAWTITARGLTALELLASELS